jgi:hypothetical protein
MNYELKYIGKICNLLFKRGIATILLKNSFKLVILSNSNSLIKLSRRKGFQPLSGLIENHFWGRLKTAFRV